MHKIQGTMLCAALCLMGMPVVFGDDCAPYVGSDFAPHQGQTCILSFCAGTCTERFCSLIPGSQLDQSQFMCIVTNLYFVVGCGAVIVLLIVVGVIACCCRSLCACFGLCCPENSHHVTRSVEVTNVVHRQPLVQMPYSTPTTGYMPVTSQNVYAGQYPPPYPGEATAYVGYPTK